MASAKLKSALDILAEIGSVVGGLMALGFLTTTVQTPLLLAALLLGTGVMLFAVY